jgi:hypothetical protein
MPRLYTGFFSALRFRVDSRPDAGNLKAGFSIVFFAAMHGRFVYFQSGAVRAHA